MAAVAVDEGSSKKRVALITGGGRGIGRACAQALAADGYEVAVCGRTLHALEETADALRAQGARAGAFSCDVTNPEEIRLMIVAVRETLGPPVVLVNNSGIAHSKKFVATDDSEWDRHLEVNLMGAVRVTREVLPAMMEAGWGRIVNIASVAARIGFLYSTAYCASKHALLGFTRALALETATRGVTVNAVCPGWVETDMANDAITRIDSRTQMGADQARATLEAMSPQKRLMQASEVASVVAYLASEAAAGVHGQAWNIDGGEVMS